MVGFRPNISCLDKRESGDQETSVLNFLINFCMFIANMSLVLEKCGKTEKFIMKVLMEIVEEGKHASMQGCFDDCGPGRGDSQGVL